MVKNISYSTLTNVALIRQKYGFEDYYNKNYPVNT